MYTNQTNRVLFTRSRGLDMSLQISPRKEMNHMQRRDKSFTFFLTCKHVIGLFLNLSIFESWRPVLRKGLSVNLQKDILVCFTPPPPTPVHHVTVMYLQKSLIFSVARQLSFYSQPIIRGWHCCICFSNLLSLLSLPNSCQLNFVWLRRTFQCCLIVSTVASFESMLHAHRRSAEREV